MDRLRVAVDATPLLGHPTGVGTFVAGLLAGLAGRPTGAEPALEVSAYALSARAWRRLPEVLPTGMRARRGTVPAAVGLRLWPVVPVPRFEWFAGAAEVVHGTGFLVPPTAAGAVVTVHDLTPLRYPELVDGASARYPAAVRAAIRRGALVHTPSRFVADEVVAELGADPDRVVAVAHGAPPAGRGDRAAGRTRAGADRYVLALGTVEPRKGLADLVRAFGLVADEDADLHLVLAGPDGWGRAAVDAATAGLAPAARRRVRRLGWVEPAPRDDLLAGATVLAYPSRYEGFGLPPLEAMAAGVPVVATDAGALPEVLGGAATLVAVGDLSALAGALAATVALDQVGRAAVVAAGRARAASFTWAACAEGMAALYARAAGA
ncbi:MAG: glycosyltransferase family 1 protein [Acidimicrobiales bacterium]